MVNFKEKEIILVDGIWKHSGGRHSLLILILCMHRLNQRFVHNYVRLYIIIILSTATFNYCIVC